MSPATSRRAVALRVAVAPVVAVVVAVGGCTGTSSGGDGSSESGAPVVATSPGTTPASDPAARIVAIEVARTATEPAVADLTAASATLVALFEAWQDDPDGVDLPVEVDGMQERVEAAVAATRTALDPAASADVAAASAAMVVAADVVADQYAAAVGMADVVALAARVDALGARFTSEINEPGSRSIQRNAMQELIAALEDVEADLVAAEPTTSCPAVLAPRRTAVTHMAAVAADLASMATNGQGAAFDDLRATATADPFGLGTTDLDTVAAPADCEAVAIVVGVGPSLDAALEDVQAALNPDDLVS